MGSSPTPGTNRCELFDINLLKKITIFNVVNMTISKKEYQRLTEKALR